MKTIGLTMRVDIIERFHERRDSIDQKWVNYIHACGYSPVFLPNNASVAQSLFSKLDGIVLTGGNNLSILGGDAPERDLLEAEILEYAMKVSMPVIGVCRGMQFLQHHFGGELITDQDHVGSKHAINFCDNLLHVNSFHSYVVRCVSDKFKVLAVAEDETVESMKHENYPFLGIMWHPERENVFSEFDLTLFKNHFM